MTHMFLLGSFDASLTVSGNFWIHETSKWGLLRMARGYFIQIGIFEMGSIYINHGKPRGPFIFRGFFTHMLRA